MSQPLHQDNPYSAPNAQLAELAQAQDELADRGTRLGANLLDGLFYVIAMIPLFIAAAASGPDGNGALMAVCLTIGLLAILGLVVVNLRLLHSDGQTLAKRLLGIRIVRSDGSRATLLRIFFARALPVGVLGAIPLIGPIVSLTDALMIFRDNRRCLHDEIADTIVVKA
jgi:uncharacterized RDD family membrane protein YckC